MEKSVFIECSTGSTPNIETIKKYIEYLSLFGYRILYLGLTDGYKLNNYPFFNYNRAGYTLEDLQVLDDYADKHNIELRASIQTLGHLDFMAKYSCYDDIFDTSSVLMVGEKKTYDFLDEVFSFFSKALRTRYIHIGLDEAESLGKGKYKIKNGERNQFDIFIEHLNCLKNIADKYKLNIEMWTDMFMKMSGQGDYWTCNCIVPDEIPERLPNGINYCYWNYWQMDEVKLDDQINQNIKLTKGDVSRLVFAGTLWKQNGIIPYNRISMKILKKQVDVCKKKKINRFMLTLWSDGGAQSSIYSVLPSLYAFSVYDNKETDLTKEDKEYFYKVVGTQYDEFMLIDYLNDPFMKDVDWFSTRSHTSFYSDLFTDYYVPIYSENSDVKYCELAEKISNIKSSYLKPFFNEMKEFAIALSYKFLLSRKIREAYEKKDKKVLKQLVDNDLTLLIKHYKLFIDNFTKRWYFENYPNGLEVNQVYYGGSLLRLKDCKRRLNDYINKDKKIYELEQKQLKPCIKETEDNLWALGIRNLISFCHF